MEVDKYGRKGKRNDGQVETSVHSRRLVLPGGGQEWGKQSP